MDDVQSWWEVPTITHFFCVFRAAFNLFHLEIGELEAAILNMQDPEMCLSLEQLIMQLLQGFHEENEVTLNNWEEKLHELFSDNSEDEENPLKNDIFAFLSPRSKVEVLYKLCEFRLDADGALEAIKDIPSEDMQAKCIGRDNQNNLYWYFCDERLYKEDPSIPTKNSGKSKLQSGKEKIIKNSTVKRSARERKSKSDDSNKSWSIVCYNLSDWEALVKTFSKSKHKQEKELAKEMKDKYLPLLSKVIAEKDRIIRKRLLKLAPKRSSQRISKVQAQKKMEQQLVEEANEKRRVKMEEEQIKKEAEKKEQETENRRKRAEEREKKMQERLCRAQQRDMMRGFCVDDLNFNEDNKKINIKSRNVQKQNPSDDEIEKSSAEDTSDDEDASQSDSENEESTKKHSSNSEISDSDEEYNNSTSIRKVYTSESVNTVSQNHVEQKSFERSSVIRNSYSVSNWNVDANSQGQKIHIVGYGYDSSSSNKRLKPNENYIIGPASTNETRPNFYNESQSYHSLLQGNLISCSKVTSTPQVIRIDFIKPPKPQVSR